MEPYMKDNVNDITYRSELILDILRQLPRNKMSRINSPKQLTFRKLWAH